MDLEIQKVHSRVNLDLDRVNIHDKKLAMEACVAEMRFRTDTYHTNDQILTSLWSELQEGGMKRSPPYFAIAFDNPNRDAIKCFPQDFRPISTDINQSLRSGHIVDTQRPRPTG